MTKSMKRSNADFSASTRKRPVGVIGERAVGLTIGVTEQVLQPAFADERVAFEVKEQVSGRRFGKAGEPEARVHRQEFVHERPCLAAFNLYSRLLAYALVRWHRAARRFPGERQRHGRERRDGLDSSTPQFLDLELGDAGDEREVIVFPPAPLASVPASGICRNALSDRGRFLLSPGCLSPRRGQDGRVESRRRSRPSGTPAGRSRNSAQQRNPSRGVRPCTSATNSA